MYTCIIYILSNTHVLVHVLKLCCLSYVMNTFTEDIPLLYNIHLITNIVISIRKHNRGYVDFMLSFVDLSYLTEVSS